jgi:hypothetical protein
MELHYGKELWGACYSSGQEVCLSADEGAVGALVEGVSKWGLCEFKDLRDYFY